MKYQNPLFHCRSRDRTRLHMFLVTAPEHSNKRKTQTLDNAVNSGTVNDGRGMESGQEHTAPPTILFLHGNAGNIGHR